MSDRAYGPLGLKWSTLSILESMVENNFLRFGWDYGGMI